MCCWLYRTSAVGNGAGNSECIILHPPLTKHQNCFFSEPRRTAALAISHAGCGWQTGERCWVSERDVFSCLLKGVLHFFEVRDCGLRVLIRVLNLLLSLWWLEISQPTLFCFSQWFCRPAVWCFIPSSSSRPSVWEYITSSTGVTVWPGAPPSSLSVEGFSAAWTPRTMKNTIRPATIPMMHFNVHFTVVIAARALNHCSLCGPDMEQTASCSMQFYFDAFSLTHIPFSSILIL